MITGTDSTQQNSGFEEAASKISIKLRDIPAKISIIGSPATGKTTLTKLIRGQLISGKYCPTIGFNLGNTTIDGNSFRLWDFGGQIEFIKQHLTKYIHGSDILFVVTDSSPSNVLITKDLLEHTKNLIDDGCEMVCIANKQDLEEHMSPKRIEDIMQIPTFPLVAIDESNRQRIIELINLLMTYVQAKKQGDISNALS